MENNPSNYQEKVRSFWHRYVEKVRESGVEPPFDRWMVKRAEDYIAAFPGRKLREQTARDVEGYLAELGKRVELKEWQFRQAVDAIRILFGLVGVRESRGQFSHCYSLV